MKNYLLYLPLSALLACNQSSSKTEETAAATASTDSVAAMATPALPEPYATPSAKNFSKVIGWPQGKMPTVPAGFTVTEYAADLQNPRWIYVAPNGDIFIAESNSIEKTSTAKGEKAKGLKQSGSMKETSANRVTLLRDADKDGKPEVRQTFLTGLNQPFGMLVVGDNFYVGNTDAVMRFPYKAGQTKITAGGQKSLDLPVGGYNNHWTRNLLANADGSKIYVSVGSGSNVMEKGAKNDEGRALILEINPDGSGKRVYASGLRNPVGMDWQPGTQVLWTAVNERDELGDDLVPDYMTSVKEGGFYGWPYSYFGQNVDPRRKGERPDLVEKAITPDVALGPHTASLGLAFYDANAFPTKYQNGAFVGQHGSWNRSEFTGYKVVFVPFQNGKPVGRPEDFMTGFVANESTKEVYGRPVGVTVLPDGTLLVADDAGGKIWRVSATQGTKL
ncbi:NHL repeat containing protein [Hymenobacter roseosalivarius DSM 11622]|uniref:NHL repeat containing protein n=1 Tax=Hymenobacter roseosalivarius DSM 11622 TaxID=645990 RepID=A0A1W1VRL7_9BACT|nr:sorbosone dehydrogenase family protein [Hymenobacter roseosalivarius]SMB96015.1 NHL repeat containing protein [Hymenobacter roseosalivarius DSM 11622]